MGTEKKKHTKQRIWESFYDLCRKMPFERITVEMVVANCGISKATFYRHFKDKYDVLNYNSTAIAGRIIGERPCKDWRDFLFYMFEEIEKEKQYYQKAFKTSGQNAHSSFLFEYSNFIVKRCYMLSNGLQEITKQEEYMIAHYCYGCVAIIEDWLNDSARLTTSQMADLFCEWMPEKIRGTWVNVT